MTWGTVARKLGTVAPAVAGAVGGPAGALVGAQLARRLGVPETPQAVAAALTSPTAVERIVVEMEPFAASASQAHTEATSTSKFVRMARPAFQFALTGAMALFAVVSAWILTFGDAVHTATLIEFVEASDGIMMAALAVFAAGSAGRSYEKKAGMADPSQRAGQKRDQT